MNQAGTMERQLKFKKRIESEATKVIKDAETNRSWKMRIINKSTVKEKIKKLPFLRNESPTEMMVRCRSD